MTVRQGSCNHGPSCCLRGSVHPLVVLYTYRRTLQYRFISLDHVCNGIHTKIPPGRTIHGCCIVLLGPVYRVRMWKVVCLGEGSQCLVSHHSRASRNHYIIPFRLSTLFVSFVVCLVKRKRPQSLAGYLL